jgi:molecular chaperone Hsp33
MARIANDNPTMEQNADDNIVQPFQLMESGLRGRIVRLGSVVNEILSAHDYPDPVSHILAEAMGLGLILASMLKFEGIFTLQTNTDGAVKALVVDVNSEGILRAYASFDENQIKAIMEDAEKDHGKEEDNRYSGLEYGALLGKGYLAFTVDQGPQTERYQGIVAVEGESLSQSVQHYFDQSEQILTCVRVAAGKIKDAWRCGALMIQKIPDEGGEHEGSNVISMDSESDHKTKEEKDDDWNRSVVLMQTCTQDEFLAPDLHSNDLLMRLFHEEGVIVYDPLAISKGCRCTQKRVENALLTLSAEERQECIKDGKVEMVCEFCSKKYVFTADEINSLEN